MIGLAVSSSCIWCFEVGSSEEKMIVGFLSCTRTGEPHVTRRITGASAFGSFTALLTSALTFNARRFSMAVVCEQSILVPTST